MINPLDDPRLSVDLVDWHRPSVRGTDRPGLYTSSMLFSSLPAINQTKSASIEAMVFNKSLSALVVERIQAFRIRLFLTLIETLVLPSISRPTTLTSTIAGLEEDLQ